MKRAEMWLGMRKQPPLAIQRELENGLRLVHFHLLAEQLRLSPEVAANLFGAPEEAIRQCVVKGSFSCTESIALFDVARLAAQTVERFGTVRRALDWLHTSHPGLNGATPLEVAIDQNDKDRVRALLQLP